MTNPLAPSPGPPEPGSEEAQQQLIFVQEYLRTNDPVLALAKAGIVDIRYAPQITARKLLEKEHIQSLITACRIAGVDQTPDVEYTRETAMARLDSIYNEARADRDRPAALAATKLQLQVQGLLTTNIDMTIHHTAGEMTTEQLLKIARRGSAIDGEFKVVDPAMSGMIEGPKK